MPTQRQMYLFLGGGESDRELAVFIRIELNQLYIAFPYQRFSISGDTTQKECVYGKYCSEDRYALQRKNVQPRILQFGESILVRVIVLHHGAFLSNSWKILSVNT